MKYYLCCREWVLVQSYINDIKEGCIHNYFIRFQAMSARRQLLKVLDELISRQHDDSKKTTDALVILKEQVDQGSLTMDELKDSIVEMLFSAYHGKQSSLPRIIIYYCRLIITAWCQYPWIITKSDMKISTCYASCLFMLDVINLVLPWQWKKIG